MSWNRFTAWLPWMRGIAAWSLAAIFLYAAIPKLIDPAGFARSIMYYKMTPLRVIHFMALLMPMWEVAASVALLIPGNWRRAGAVMTLGMSVIFMIAVGTAVYRGLDMSCGCFGEDSAKVGYPLLALDLSIFLVSLWIIRTEPGEFSWKTFFSRTSSAGSAQPDSSTASSG